MLTCVMSLILVNRQSGLSSPHTSKSGASQIAYVEGFRGVVLYTILYSNIIAARSLENKCSLWRYINSTLGQRTLVLIIR